MNRTRVMAAVVVACSGRRRHPLRPRPSCSRRQKSSGKPEDLNPRGQWLLAEKGKTKSPDVKADWLKNYPGGD
jgi:hypothetical protein